ncbi:MAG: DUF4384 domain-containing protein [Acidobacteriota bacterium]|nr:DUF4384 domain-containing protein [Acidobacteriota bacterium]
MRFRPLLTLAAFALLVCAPAARAQQQQDQKVIDDFVGSRGVSFDEPARKTTPPRTPPHAGTHRTSAGAKNAGGVASGGKGSPNVKATSTGAASNQTASAGANDGAGDAGNKGGAQTLKASATNGSRVPIALGYTVYMKDSTGGLRAVDPTREYKAGDRIVIALEPNTEGYIYIFNAENDRDAAMLFPNAQLDAGANAAHAHVRETYPADARYAFEFDANPAIEHLYVVVSRRPLEGVPVGSALVEACKGCDEYGWKPTAEEWARIKSGAAGGHVIEAKNAQLAQLQKPVQPVTLQRGIKIKRDDPAPAVVRVNDSADADALVTVIKLVHK